MLKIDIIILNWNGAGFIKDCLASVASVVKTNFSLETIVVDNASTDDSAKTIRESFPWVKLLVNKENLGFAQGNNIGIEYALKNGADYIMLLNNDTIVDKNLIEELVKMGENDGTIGILGPKIYFAKGYEFYKNRYQEEDKGKVIWYAGGIIDWDNILASHRGVDEVDSGQYDKVGETDYVSGCCLIVKRKVFEKVGFLDPKYYLYYEENDFEQRAKKDGFKIVYVPKAFLWHLNAASSSSGSKLQEYYIARNRLLFGMHFAPIRAKIALLKESLKTLINGNYWTKKGILDFYLMKFGKGSYSND